MTDHTVRAENGNPLLDADGDPIVELALESVDEAEDTGATVVELAFGKRSWRFGHVIVDEAQDLSPMQWRMVARRARRGSMTIVGDLAQRSIGAPGTWADHIPSSLGDFSFQELTINYRAPEEVNRVASGLLAELAPGLTPGRSIRSVGHHPAAIRVDSVSASIASAVADAEQAVPEGTAAVIATPETLQVVASAVQGSVALLTPWQCKGLEFDSVVVVEPSEILAMKQGLSLLYVAVTRTTNRLTFVHAKPLPDLIAVALQD